MSDGCPHCESEIRRNEPKLESLGDFRDAFSSPGGYFYFNVRRCPECGTAWADVYHEWDCSDTVHKEWGHRDYYQRRLSERQVERLHAELGRGVMDFKRFLDAAEDTDEAAEGTDEAAEATDGSTADLSQRMRAADAMEAGAAAYPDPAVELSALERALAARRAIVEDSDADAPRIAYAATLRKIAWLRAGLGEFGASRVAFEESAATIRALPDASRSQQTLTGLAESMAGLGWVLLQTDERAPALDAATEGGALLKACRDEFTDGGWTFEMMVANVGCMTVRAHVLLKASESGPSAIDKAHESVHAEDHHAAMLQDMCDDLDDLDAAPGLATLARFWRVREAVARAVGEDADADESAGRALQLEARI
jgi:hypothetical protein